jgi:hypothetical protein
MRIPTPQLIGLFVLASILGSSFMFIKVLLDEVSPIAVGWMRRGAADRDRGGGATTGAAPRWPLLAQRDAGGGAGLCDPV